MPMMTPEFRHSFRSTLLGAVPKTLDSLLLLQVVREARDRA
jgi:hypothetical protein